MFAVLVADLMLAKSLALVVDGTAEAANAIAELIGIACEGRIRELAQGYNLELTEAEHLEIIRLKTGTLFELPCRLGAELGGAAPATVAALAAYGRNLGLAFQLADDALDLAGHASRLGKPVAADVREGVYSLPVLRVLKREGRDGPLGSLLGQAHLEPDEITAAIAMVRASGTIEETLTLAATYSDRAISAITMLPATSAHRSLVNLARYAVQRDLGADSDASQFLA
jgi:geranylgeranyl pyrophosphate synthase